MHYARWLSAAGLIIFASILFRKARKFIDSEFRPDPRPAYDGARLSQRDVLVIAGLLCLLLVLGALTNILWYLPAQVPHAVREAAHAALPGWFEIEDIEQAASPLHWRVTFHGQSRGANLFIYTQHRFFDSENITLTARASPTRFLIFGMLFVATVLMALRLYRTLPARIGRKCPSCESRPFSRTRERLLMLGRGDSRSDGDLLFPPVYVGHFSCPKCGLNRLEVYEKLDVSPTGRPKHEEAPEVTDVLEELPGDAQGASESEIRRHILSYFAEREEREWYDDISL